MEKEVDVTGPALRELRLKQGKSQDKFWGEVLVKNSTGAHYEAGRNELPEIVRRVCYLHFVCGLDINMQEPEKITTLLEQAKRINAIASNLKEAVVLIEGNQLNESNGDK